MMNFSEGVASRYGIREAVIAQHLWELGEDAEFADAVVKNEYPVHYEVLCQKLAYLAGSDKATQRVKRMVDANIYLCRTEIIEKDDFYYPIHYSEIIPRLPNERKIQHISKEELMMAMAMILKNCYGANREALINETARVYGFSRSGQNIYSAMNDALDQLIKNKEIAEEEGKLKLLQ